MTYDDEDYELVELDELRPGDRIIYDPPGWPPEVVIVHRAGYRDGNWFIEFADGRVICDETIWPRLISA